MKRNEILEAAARCVCTDRNAQYGEPEDNFRLIGEFWARYIKARCVSGGADVTVDPADVAMMMVLFKVAREATAVEPKVDTFVDIAGYAACGGEIATACRGESPAEEESGDTYLDVMRLLHPDWIPDKIISEFCPSKCFEIKEFGECGEETGNFSCESCWNRKYRGEKVIPRE